MARMDRVAGLGWTVSRVSDRPLRTSAADRAALLGAWLSFDPAWDRRLPGRRRVGRGGSGAGGARSRVGGGGWVGREVWTGMVRAVRVTALWVTAFWDGGRRRAARPGASPPAPWRPAPPAPR